VFAPGAKTVPNDGKWIFHRFITANLPAALNPQQVLKLALILSEMHRPAGALKRWSNGNYYG
jgi:hypothetical protein